LISTKEQGIGLLTFLRRIGPIAVAMLDDGIEWSTFDGACTELRMALRDGPEPGWRDETDVL
jgi:hypothetical protein